MTSIAQRQELQAKIWKIANDVRGSVHGWDITKLNAEIFKTVKKIDNLRADIDAILKEIEL